MRLRLDRRPAGLLARVRQVAPAALWAGEELVVPGPARYRPKILNAVRAEGVEVRGLSAEEGRLDALYRELVVEASA
jgi:Cu-processing system ATP-binding protein